MSQYRICLLGDGGVGKTAITIQFCSSIFVDEYDPTIEDSFRKATALDGEEVIIDLLDTAGQEEFRALREKWILSSDGFIIVYSITSKESFEIIDNFVNQIVKTTDKDKTKIPLTLIGNKSDLENKREVSKSDGENKAKDIGPDVKFVETSAKERTNIDEPILDLIRTIRKSKPEKPKSKFNCYIL
eukprot:TRINITY_DN182_c0_g1_i2.p1 TRINITY_DN182_c0_g1~~TRINITY_DN182_c0_g1_i2.p1  ORF type:complete len:186 (-),score=40.69 TRINITY_DN182_c0_g1_i2:47-604(-)